MAKLHLPKNPRARLAVKIIGTQITMIAAALLWYAASGDHVGIDDGLHGIGAAIIGLMFYNVLREVQQSRWAMVAVTMGLIVDYVIVAICFIPVIGEAILFIGWFMFAILVDAWRTRPKETELAP